MAEYNDYKDSNIGNVGLIPAHWNMTRIGNLFKEIAERYVSGTTDVLPLLSVSEYYGVAKRSEKIADDSILVRAESLDGYKICQAGDIVSNIMLAWKGALGCSGLSGIVSPAYCVYRPKMGINSRYYHYLFRTKAYTDIFHMNSTGLIDSRLRLYTPKFFALHAPVTEISEQNAIVEYLDSKIASIDSVIAESKASIEEYKAWKESIIYEAVTKGLDPDVEMKDSGIDIIGIMPSHWETCRLKYLCDVMTGNQDTQNADDNGEYPFYVRSPIVQRANVYTYEGEGILMAGDGAGAGRVFHHAFGKYAIHQRVYCFNNFRNINTDYYLYFISELFKKVMDKGSAQSTVPSVRLPMIQDFVFCIPPEEEQKMIVEHLEKRCSNIDALISEKEALITDLEAYKKSLVFEVVTGKRKVV